MTQKPLKAPAIVAIAMAAGVLSIPALAQTPAGQVPRGVWGEIPGWVWQDQSPEHWPWDGGCMIAAHTPDQFTCYAWEDHGRGGGWHNYDLPLASATKDRTSLLIGCPLIARFTPAGEENCMKQEVFPDGDAKIFRDVLISSCNQKPIEIYMQILDENDSLAIPPVKVVCPPQD